jgi:UDP-glucose:(heptosyl)LPS alpha-1,3-glucosyltransferase
VRIAVISPFVDRRHGTERAVAELIERLAQHDGDEVQLYSQRVDDITLSDARAVKGKGRIVWHPVGVMPGPHVLGFLGWLFLNRWKRRNTGERPDVVFSPGINAFDADVIQVHAMFHRLAELRTGRKRFGLRGLHRGLYYAIVCALERRIYGNKRTLLAAVSPHTAGQLARYFGRTDVTVVPYGVDRQRFCSSSLAPMRQTFRSQWKIRPDEFALLLIGNDWRNKGLRALLAAVALCKDLPLRLLVVGQDEQAPFRAETQKLGLSDRVEFLPQDEEVRKFYAAADVLVAPSLEDSFNLPVLEAMACLLPVIVSLRAGVSEWLKNGFDSLLLSNPEDPGELAEAIRALATDGELRKTLAENGAHTATKFSWDAHAAQLRQLMVAAAKRKRGSP